MPRLISEKRYQRLVKAEREFLQRPVVVPDANQKPNWEELHANIKAEFELVNMDLRNKESMLLGLAQILNPKITTLAEALDLANKFKK